MKRHWAFPIAITAFLCLAILPAFAYKPYPPLPTQPRPPRPPNTNPNLPLGQCYDCQLPKHYTLGPTYPGETCRNMRLMCTCTNPDGTSARVRTALCLYLIVPLPQVTTPHSIQQ
jgi:hypothetical protein